MRIALVQEHPCATDDQALAVARDLDLVIAFTFLEESPQGTTGAPRNTVAIVDRRGEVVHRYAKTHTCAFGDERWCQPGDAFPVTTVDTREGPVALVDRR